MSNTATRPATAADLTPSGPTLAIPRPARLPSLNPPPGTTLITWRGSRPSEFIRTDDLGEHLTRVCGGGWEHGADGSGFEDFTVRDDEGDVLAELEHY